MSWAKAMSAGDPLATGEELGGADVADVLAAGPPVVAEALVDPVALPDGAVLLDALQAVKASAVLALAARAIAMRCFTSELQVVGIGDSPLCSSASTHTIGVRSVGLPEWCYPCSPSTMGCYDDGFV